MDRGLPRRAIRACMGCANLLLLLAALATLLSFAGAEHWRRIFALIAALNLALSLFLLMVVLAAHRQYPEDHDR